MYRVFGPGRTTSNAAAATNTLKVGQSGMVMLLL